MLATQLSGVFSFCVHMYLPVQDLPHARHPHGPDPSRAGCASLETESHSPPPPNPQAKCKETGSHRGLLDLQLHWEGWKAQQHSCQKHGDRVRCCSVLRGPRLPGPSVSPQVLLCLQFLITPP